MVVVESGTTAAEGAAAAAPVKPCPKEEVTDACRRLLSVQACRAARALAARAARSSLDSSPRGAVASCVLVGVGMDMKVCVRMGEGREDSRVHAGL